MSRRRHRTASEGGSAVDTSVRVGSLVLPMPIMPASGTAGHSTELAGYLDLASLGAFVTKSLAVEPWEGNASPRVHQTPAGMINSVGLQGPGLAAWRRDGLPRLLDIGVERIVVSVWGRTVEEYRVAASMVADLPPEVVAVEVNLSCPNLDGGRHLFAHDPEVAAEVVSSMGAVARPMWAKLSPNTDRLTEVAAAVQAAGAEAVTLTNTLLGMVIDVATRRPLLGGGGGGVSGPAMHPVAVRCVWETRQACPDLPIVGVGGIASGVDAVELLLAGANALQVGTASFARPTAVQDIADELVGWCERHGVRSVAELTGGAHGGTES